MEKKCNGCNKLLDISMFGKESRISSGLKYKCKKCLNRYYNENYSKYKERKSERSKKYVEENKQIISLKRKAYREREREQISKQQKIWRENNREYLNKKSNEREKSRVANDAEYRCKKNMRKLIYRLKIEKRGKTSVLLGYTIDDLKLRLGRLPNKNESFDHKIPVSWFISYDDCKTINSLDNIQILSRSENSKKNNTFSHPISKQYYEEIKHKIKPEYLSLIKIL